VARLPRPQLPDTGRIREWIRTRVLPAFRRVGYAAGDVLFLIGRGLAGMGRGFATAGAAIRSAWFNFSLTTRRRIAAAAALVIFVSVFWFAAIPALPCQFPGGDECPPEDDAVKIVPGDALAYAHANVDTETQQYEEAVAITGRLPTLTEQLIALLPGPGGAALDFEKDISPWIAGEVAGAIVPGEGGRPEQTLYFEVADTDGANGFAESLASGPTSESEHGGETIRVDQRGNASAVVSGFLVLGTLETVERTIDVANGDARSVSSSPLGEQVLDEVPDEAIAEVAVSEAGVEELLAVRGSSFGSLEAFVNFEASSGAAAGLIAEEGTLEFVIHSDLDADRLESSPGFFSAFDQFEPSLNQDLGADTLAYLGVGNPAESVEDLFTQAIAEAPGVATGFTDVIEDLQRSGKLDVQSELLPLLEGEAAFAIEPSDLGADGSSEAEAEIPGEDVGPPDAPGQVDPEELVPPEGAPPAPGVAPSSGVPYLLFVADDVDEEAAREAFAKLQGPLAAELDPDTGLQAPVFEEREIEGVQASSLRLSPTVDLTYATFGGKVVVATRPEGIAEVAGGDGGLTDTESYEKATEDLPEEPSMLVYLNFAELIALAEREGLAEDPAYALFAGDIRRLSALGLAVERTEDALDTTIRIPVSGTAD